VPTIQDTMGSPTADRLCRAYALLNAGGEVDWSFIDPAIRHDHTEGIFLDGIFYGPEGIQAAQAEVESDWDDVRYELEETIDMGDRVLLMLRMRARVRDTDAELDAQVSHLWEFRDGLAVRWDVFGDRISGLRALSAAGSGDTFH
jgi:ketosteroid isomerase-like protein